MANSFLLVSLAVIECFCIFKARKFGNDVRLRYNIFMLNEGDSNRMNSEVRATNVVVTVLGVQRDIDGEENAIELVTVGRYYRKNNVDYITYQESEITGMEGTATMLKIYDDHVILSRTGSVEHKQEFRLGECCKSTYVTAYGRIEMSIMTSKLTVSFGSQDNTVDRIDIGYELELDGHWQSANTLSIIVRGEQKNGH